MMPGSGQAPFHNHRLLANADTRPGTKNPAVMNGVRRTFRFFDS